MLIRLLLITLLFTACRSGEIACPEVKTVKLKKKPMNYRMRMQSQSITASAREEDRTTNVHMRGEVPVKQIRPVKSLNSIEEWDCPKPGTKNALPKSVRENIKKNRKKFDSYYKSRSFPDSVQNNAATGVSNTKDY